MIASLSRRVRLLLAGWALAAAAAYSIHQRMLWTASGSFFGFVDVAVEVVNDPLFVCYGLGAPWCIAFFLASRSLPPESVCIRAGSLKNVLLVLLRSDTASAAVVLFGVLTTCWVCSLGLANDVARVPGSVSALLSDVALPPPVGVLLQLPLLLLFLATIGSLLSACWVLSGGSVLVGPAATVLLGWFAVSAAGGLPRDSAVSSALLSSSSLHLGRPFGVLAAAVVLLSIEVVLLGAVRVQDRRLSGAARSWGAGWAAYVLLLGTAALGPTGLQSVSEGNPAPGVEGRVLGPLFAGPAGALAPTLFSVLVVTGFAMTWQLSELDPRRPILRCELIRYGSSGARNRRLGAGLLARALGVSALVGALAGAEALLRGAPGELASFADPVVGYQLLVNGTLQLTLVAVAASAFAPLAGSGAAPAAFSAGLAFLPSELLEGNPLGIAGLWRSAEGWPSVLHGTALALGSACIVLVAAAIASRLVERHPRTERGRL
ncbi:hypothetical protein MT356_16470 [Rathayibacter festucae]|uniref:hypothetical protein n=1 Tax=Rathayibacter festucae TaxID=110937 RepID=UPI001FB41265|nr:hypothetical protein [Rathayibacter festucae]MCJ1701305.1 hypothetical protein [Rathayibacter festucae]